MCTHDTTPRLPATLTQSLPDGDIRTSTREPSYTRETSRSSPPLPSSYPGTVVKAWHARDALVALFSLFQKKGWMGRLALGTVSTDALMEGRGRTGAPGSEMGRESLVGMPSQNPGPGHCAQWSSTRTLSLPRHIPAALLCPQGTPSQQLALSFLQEEAQVGPSQSAFQTGAWEEMEGPAEGPSVPAVPATCTRSEDKPQGSRMKRLVPNASTSAWGCQERAARGAGSLWTLQAGLKLTTVTGSTGPWV